MHLNSPMSICKIENFFRVDTPGPPLKGMGYGKGGEKREGEGREGVATDPIKFGRKLTPIPA